MTDSIKFQCPECRARLKLKATTQKTVVTCPQCGAAVAVPTSHVQVASDPIPEFVERPSKKPAPRKLSAGYLVGIPVAVVVLVGIGIWATPPLQPPVQVDEEPLVEREEFGHEEPGKAQEQAPPMAPEDDPLEPAEMVVEEPGEPAPSPYLEIGRLGQVQREQILEQRKQARQSIPLPAELEALRREVANMITRSTRDETYSLGHGLLRLAHAARVLEPQRESLQQLDLRLRTILANKLAHFDPVERYMSQSKVSLSPDGRYTLVATPYGEPPIREIQVWDLEENKEVKRLKCFNSYDIGMLPSGNRNRVVIWQPGESWPDKARLKLWDWIKFDVIDLPITDVGLHPSSYSGNPRINHVVDFDGKHIFVADKHRIGLWNLEEGRLVSQGVAKHLIHRFAFSPNNKHLAIQSTGGVTALELPSLKPIEDPRKGHWIGPHETADMRVFSSDGTIMRVTHAESKKTTDFLTNDEIPTNHSAFEDYEEAITHGKRFLDVRGSPTGARAAFRLRTPSVAAPILFKEMKVAVSADRDVTTQQLLVVSPERMVAYDDRFREIQVFQPVPDVMVIDTLFIRNGTTAMVMLSDGTVGLWHIPTSEWKVLNQFEETTPIGLGHVDERSHVIAAFVAKNRNLEFRIWKSETGREIGKPIQLEWFPKSDVKEFELSPQSSAQRLRQLGVVSDYVRFSQANQAIVLNTLDGVWKVAMQTGKLANQFLLDSEVFTAAAEVDWHLASDAYGMHRYGSVVHAWDYGPGISCQISNLKDGVKAELIAQPMTTSAQPFLDWLELRSARKMKDISEWKGDARDFDILTIEEWEDRLKQVTTELKIPIMRWSFEES